MGFFHRHSEQEYGQTHETQYPPAVTMQVLNGLVVLKPNRLPPTRDYDQTPIQYRRYVDTGMYEVQLECGVMGGRYDGRILHTADYMVNNSVAADKGWVTVYQTPRQPGKIWQAQTYGGTHMRGIDPLSYGALFDAGPGSQPANPGGPGRLAGDSLLNPMTG